MNTDQLAADFRQGFALFGSGGTLDNLMSFIDERCVILDEDLPFPMTKAQYRDHLEFRQSNWESMAWMPYDTRYDVEGQTGIVSTGFTIRGKPRGSGFRLRHGLATVVCHYEDGLGSWQAVSLTMDPLLGHIEGASPA